MYAIRSYYAGLHPIVNNGRAGDGVHALPVLRPCAMVFSSVEFLFVFLPAFLALYALSRRKNLTLFLASLLFYFWGVITSYSIHYTKLYDYKLTGMLLLWHDICILFCII